MLNKKAIAAFAAGATLLSGFAFAAPAMAEVTVPDTCPAEKPLKSKNAAVTAQAKKDWEDAKKAVPANPGTKPVAGTDVDSTMYTQDGNEGKLKMNDIQVTAANRAKYLATVAFVNATNDYVVALAAYTPKHNEAERLHNVYLRALEFENTCSTPDPDPKDEVIDRVYAAKHVLDNKDNALAKAKKAYRTAADNLHKAQTEFLLRTAAANAAQRAYDAFEASGVKDSAKEQRLADAVDRANAHVARATDAQNKAQDAYNDAYNKALAAKADYDDAYKAYKDVYNEAIKLGVDPSKLPPLVTADPLDLTFNPVPGVAEAFAAAERGDFGPAAQAAAKKGKDTKASAQQNNKKNNAASADANGASASAAAQLPKSGAAVAMAAVAASVLAGMGAALRKIRH